MLFTINFDQTRKMKQEEAAKNNACFGRSFCHDKNRSRYSGMGKKEGQISSPVCKGIIWVRLFFFKCLLMSTWLTWTPYFLEVHFCICVFLYLFVGCLGHDFLDGLRPPCILGAFFRRAISVVQGGPPFFYLKNAGVHVSRKIPRRIHFSIAPSIAPSFLSSFTFSFVLSFFSDPFLDTQAYPVSTV